ncbi:CoA transferase family III [Acidovorax sp. 107]|jgi:hypothetical protein|uniref:CoA transferase n=1 Tax=Acidovorax sp. 107 TaxID=2135638 RepID=UPI000D360C4D|nr:CoA transferase [Acidovorax sp. 107]PUA93436.1 CoA transferase family III [Acidovorax sp. 107]
MLETILSDCRVLDLTQNAAGTFRAQALGDFGAEVIKIERPGSGDDARQGKPPEMGGQSTGFPALDATRRACASISNLPVNGAPEHKAMGLSINSQGRRGRTGQSSPVLGARADEVLVACGLNAQELVELRRSSVVD